MSSNESTVVALLEERRGYEVRGMKDRVAQVDAELAKFGVEVEKPKPAKAAAKKAAAKPVEVETSEDAKAAVESPEG